MYNPFAQSGGFGAMTDYYSGLGRDYTTATGGNIFGNASGGGGGSNPYSYDDSAGLNSSTAPRGGAGDYFNWEMSQLNNKGIGSDAGQSPSQYQNQYPVVDWNKWATQVTAPNGVSNQQANPWGTSPGYDYNNPSSYTELPAGGFQPMNNPSAQKLLGYDPGQIPNYGGNDAFNREMYQQVQRDELRGRCRAAARSRRSGRGCGTSPAWASRGSRSPRENPWGNTGQQGVTDPMGYGTGGYQGNAIPAQTPVQQQQQQPNNLPWFWQSIRDLAGADPKDQSRIPQDTGGYPGMTNPNYQPGGMTPQQSVPYLRDTWTNAS